jgi:hypothetical protein
MAQTNYTPISLYYSATASATPTAGNLVAGELAINTADGKLFYKDSSGVVQTLASKATSSGVFTSVTDSGLTSGRVTYATTGGLLTDSANLTFNGTTLTLANDASISGLTVGKGGGAGAGNTAFGYGVLAGNTTGTNNTATGYQALGGATVTGTNNSAYGQQSLYSNTSGANNIAYGNYALYSNTTASNNTALGYQAGYNNITGANNTAIGNGALYSNTIRSYSVAIGSQASYYTTGAVNIAIGYQALYGSSGVSTGTSNIAIGYQALVAHTTGNGTVAIGYLAGSSQTSGTNNTFIGYQSGFSNTTGTPNTFLGYNSGFSSTTSSFNTFLGNSAGYSTTTGAYNVAVGDNALANNTTASYSTAVGYQALNLNTTGGGQAFGYQALYTQTTGTNNSAFGYRALYVNTVGYQNIAMGDYALGSNTSGNNNVAIGVSSLRYNTTGSYNTAIGYQAGYSNTTGADNTAVGISALYGNTTGGSNAAFGENALTTNSTGSYNVALGQQALYSNSTASNNTAVGYQAGYSNTTAGYNTFVGYLSGQASNYTADAFANNTFIGALSGSAITTGRKNTILGLYTGNQGGLDIRTASNYIVLSDGDGNPRGIFDNSGNFLVSGTTPNSWTSNGSVTIGSGSGAMGYNANIGTGTGGLYFMTATAGGGRHAGTVAYDGTSNYMWFETNAAEKMRIDSSGNVGIGTSSPNAPLHVVGEIYAAQASANSQQIRLTPQASGANIIYSTYSGTNSYLPLAFNVGGSEVMRLDTSGNLGLGVTPSAWVSGDTIFQIKSGTSYASLWGRSGSLRSITNSYYDGTNYKYASSSYAPASFQIENTGQFSWNTAPTGTAGNNVTFTQAMTLTNSGQLLIGATSAVTATPALQVSKANSLDYGQLFLSSTDSVAADKGGGVSFGGSYTGTSPTYWAGIFGLKENATDGAYGGYLTFNTRPNGGSGTERMRIDSSGNLLVGTTSSTPATANGLLFLPSYGGANKGLLYQGVASSSSSDTSYNLYSTTASAYRFYVDLGGAIHATSTSIVAISDQSLKTNVKPLETGLAEVMKLQPRRFDWINGDATNVAGFIAQEVEAVLPDLVADFKYNDEETKLGLKMGDMIPTLVKAIQELKAEVDSLKQQLNGA